MQANESQDIVTPHHRHHQQRACLQTCREETHLLIEAESFAAFEHGSGGDTVRLQQMHGLIMLALMCPGHQDLVELGLVMSTCSESFFKSSGIAVPRLEGTSSDSLHSWLMRTSLAAVS